MIFFDSDVYIDVGVITPTWQSKDNGSRHSASTVKNLLSRLNGMSVESGTLIWDRGNVSKSYVKMVEDMKWKLICGILKTSKEAKEAISTTDVPIGPDTLARSSRAGHIYAICDKNAE
ncbi:MAG: hypothetical protein WAV32_02770 [Halobacteriota archaeon]